MKIRNLLCKIFGHNWYLFKRDVNDLANGKLIKSCHRCYDLQEYKKLPVYNWCWVSLVGYTKNFGNSKMKSLEEVK